MKDPQGAWQGISARVDLLVRAAEVFIQAQQVQSEDPYGIAFKVFGTQAQAVRDAIIHFRQRYEPTLPPATITALESFLAPDGLGMLLKGTGIAGLDLLKVTVPILAGICAEVSHTLADVEATGSRLTERAFGHLQRTIAVVPNEAAEWRAAFSRGEIACEKLGALHLLRFGLFPFKVDSIGARTDLIYGEPLSSEDPLLASSEALLLTEWKKLGDSSEAESKGAAARQQLKRYGAGPLLGVELRSVRFVVLVSEHQCDLPPDELESEIRYRHVNIAVAPRLPSQTT